MRAVALAKYPFVFAAGWLFNFVVDIQFLAHTWLGDILF